MRNSKVSVAGRVLGFACAVLVAALMLTGCEGAHPLLGQQAPELKLPLLDGGELDLAAHEGKDVVLLDFWASWCPPCRKALPAVAETAKAYEGKPVAVYAVNLRESEKAVQDFIDNQELDVQVALDAEGISSDRFKISGIPQTVVIDKDGVVAHVHVGWSLGLKAELSGHIDAALEAKATD